MKTSKLQCGNHIRSGFENQFMTILKKKYNFFLEASFTTIHTIAVSNDGKIVITVSDENLVNIWSLDLSKQINSFMSSNISKSCITVTNDGKFIAFGSSNCSVEIQSTINKKSTKLVGHTEIVQCVVATNDSNYIISGSYDKTIRIWNIQQKTQKVIITDHSNRVNCITITKDNRYIVSGSYGIRVWNFQTQIQKAVFESSIYLVESLAVTSDNKYIVSISTSKYNKIQLFNLPEKRLEAVLEGHTKRVLVIGLSIDNKYVISYSRDTTIRLWSIESKNQESVVKTIPYHKNRCVAISNDNIYFNSGIPKTNLDIYNCIERQKKLQFPGHTMSVTSIALTSDYEYIITGSYDMTVRIWNFQNKAEIDLFKFHQRPVECVGITDDDKYMMSFSGEKLRIWDSNNSSKRGMIRVGCFWMKKIKSMAMTKNRRYIVATVSEKNNVGEYTYIWKISLKEFSRLFGKKARYR